MSNSIINQLPELLKANVISDETAQKIKEYYSNNGDKNQSNLFVVFGILGAFLSGLGIILILAHNWDDLSNMTKSIISFFPLLIGQLFCGYSILKKPESMVWRESSSVFLFLGIGASISLIAQVYNISGDLKSFILIWMLLSLPLVYLLQSSMISLLYIIGFIAYCYNSGYNNYQNEESILYCLLILGIFPHYYELLKTKTQSNFSFFHNWFISFAIIIFLTTITLNFSYLRCLCYMTLFTVYYFVGSYSFFENQKIKFNSYLTIGKLGILFMLFIYSFKDYWKFLREFNLQQQFSLTSIEFMIAIVLTTIALALFYKKNNKTSFKNWNLIEIVFLLNIVLFFVGEIAMILANILILAIGILEIKRGNNLNDLKILNFGLIIVTILIICRFFDTEFSFIIRGILFITLGLGLFLTNYLMLKKRNRNEK